MSQEKKQLIQHNSNNHWSPFPRANRLLRFSAEEHPILWHEIQNKIKTKRTKVLRFNKVNISRYFITGLVFISVWWWRTQWLLSAAWAMTKILSLALFYHFGFCNISINVNTVKKCHWCRCVTMKMGWPHRYPKSMLRMSKAFKTTLQESLYWRRTNMSLVMNVWCAWSCFFSRRALTFQIVG